MVFLVANYRHLSLQHIQNSGNIKALSYPLQIGQKTTGSHSTRKQSVPSARRAVPHAYIICLAHSQATFPSSSAAHMLARFQFSSGVRQLGSSSKEASALPDRQREGDSTRIGLPRLEPVLELSSELQLLSFAATFTPSPEAGVHSCHRVSQYKCRTL